MATKPVTRSFLQSAEQSTSTEELEFQRQLQQNKRFSNHRSSVITFAQNAIAAIENEGNKTPSLEKNEKRSISVLQVSQEITISVAPGEHLDEVAALSEQMLKEMEDVSSSPEGEFKSLQELIVKVHLQNPLKDQKTIKQVASVTKTKVGVSHKPITAPSKNKTSDQKPPLRQVRSAPYSKEESIYQSHVRPRSKSQEKYDGEDAGKKVLKDNLKKHLSHLMRVPTLLPFDEKVASNEIQARLNWWDQNKARSNSDQSKGLLVEILVEIRDQSITAIQQERLSKTLMLLANDPKNASFLHAYFREIGNEGADTFAYELMKKLPRQKDHATISSIINEFTKLDFQADDPQTTISSVLCREYGIYSMRKQTESLCNSVKIQLKSFNPSKLVLEWDSVKKILQRDLKFNQLTQEAQTKKIEERRNENVAAFIKFAKSTLNILYAMPVPEQFSELLRMRRSQTQEFLKLKESKEESLTPELLEKSLRISASELMFLQILNPALMDSESTTNAKSIMRNLTKVIEHLSNEQPFGEEENDSMFAELKPLYKEFSKIHSSFIDRNIMPKKSLNNARKSQPTKRSA